MSAGGAATSDAAGEQVLRPGSGQARPFGVAQDRLVIFDGHGIIFRAYYAMQGQGRQPLIAKRSGEPTSAVYGFVNTLLSAIEELAPTHVAVAMDAPGPTFRHEADESYKAHRPPMPDDLPPQIERCKQVIEAFGIPMYEIEGFEADDTLAALADQAGAAGVETWIATLDSDLLQLVRPGVHVFMYRPYQRDTVLYDSAAKVRDRYGIDPEQIIDFKGLKGDASDNIPGVPGIGEKTAVALLNQYRSMEEIYAHLDAVKPARAQKALRENREIALHSKRMATIEHDVPVALDLDAARRALGDYDRERVVKLFMELEFRSLIDRLPEAAAAQGADALSASPEGAPSMPDVDGYTVIRSPAVLKAFVERARAAPLVAVDLETSEVDTMRARIAGYALSIAAGEAVYVAVEHPDEGEPLIEAAEARRVLKPLLEDPAVPKVLHHAKFDLKALARHGISLRGVQSDTMIAAYLLGEPALGLKALALERLGVQMTPISDLIGTGAKQKSICEVPVSIAAPYACADADMTLRLHTTFEEQLATEPQIAELYRSLELPLIDVLAAMELRGIAMDGDGLRNMAEGLADEIRAVEREIHLDVGHEFNVASPKQMSHVLFVELGLPKTRKVSHGYTTDANALERLAGVHPVIERILQYRELSKLKSTYVDTLPALVNPETGRIHTEYKQTVAATGRLSSENPNLQNIPVRTEMGRRIRAAFVPRNGEDLLFLSADYSQIELRILAHLSRDPGLIEAFQAGEDIHASTASSVYGVPPADIDAEMRRVAKMMNFGVIYGLTDYGLAQRSGIERHAARAFIDAYFARFAGVREYIEQVKESTRERGYAETLLGRRRYIPEIRSSNFPVRAAAERVAVNMPVQGTAADVMKHAMLQVHHAIREQELAAQMLLQVHDELIFEVPEREVAVLSALLEAIMPQAIEMIVPLQIDIKTGPTWGALE